MIERIRENFRNSQFINSRLLLILSICIDLILIVVGGIIFYTLDLVPDEVGSVSKDAIYITLTIYYIFAMFGLKYFNYAATEEKFIKKSNFFGRIPITLQFAKSEWKKNIFTYFFIAIIQLIYISMIICVGLAIFLGSAIVELPVSSYVSYKNSVFENKGIFRYEKEMKNKIDELENTLDTEIKKRKQVEKIMSIDSEDATKVNVADGVSFDQYNDDLLVNDIISNKKPSKKTTKREQRRAKKNSPKKRFVMDSHNHNYSYTDESKTNNKENKSTKKGNKSQSNNEILDEKEILKNSNLSRAEKKRLKREINRKLRETEKIRKKNEKKRKKEGQYNIKDSYVENYIPKNKK